MCARSQGVADVSGGGGSGREFGAGGKQGQAGGGDPGEEAAAMVTMSRRWVETGGRKCAAAAVAA